MHKTPAPLPIFALMGLLTFAGASGMQKRPNILFLVVDDLRTELGCYGVEEVHSPSIDRLADEGTTFERAYCNYPVCGASRCSVLTGLRPSKDRFTHASARVEQDAPDAITLPEHFKNHGYHTISNGKVFHDHGNVLDGMDGWSELPWEPHPGFWVWREGDNSQYDYRGYRYRKEYFKHPGPLYESPDIPDDGYPTGVVTNKTLHDLQRLKEMGQPFFLAVGYRKPHLPFNAPKKYWNLYDRDQIRVPENKDRAPSIPDQAYRDNGELYSYRGLKRSDPIDDATIRKLKHGYYACVSYTDAQVGRILDELDRLELSDNTIVILWGDHGWQLGEHTLWSKVCNFHDSLNAPLIVKVPEVTSGSHTDALVEFVDMYPTLCELAGLPLPGHLHGKSFDPVLNDPGSRVKEAAFSRNSNGETIITDRYVYTEWWDSDDQIIERMMFDLEADPLEQHNLAKNPEMDPTIQDLSQRLRTQVLASR